MNCDLKFQVHSPLCPVTKSKANWSNTDTARSLSTAQKPPTIPFFHYHIARKFRPARLSALHSPPIALLSFR